MSSSSPLTENVRRRIEAYVEEKEIEVGERLPSERVLAEHFGVSRASLRKALATLEEAGIVASVHGSGTYVTEISRQAATNILATTLLEDNRDLPEIVPVRSVLESLAARLAALNHSDSDLKHLDEAVNGMDAAVSAGTSGAEYSIAFHQTLWSASSNNLLTEQLQSLQPHFNRLRIEAVAQPQSLPKSVEWHAHILEAIRNSDPYRAASLMEEHILDLSQSPLAQSNLSTVCI